MKRIEKVLYEMKVYLEYEKNEDDNWYGLVEFWTDSAGQDIPTEFDFDGTAEDFVKEFVKCANNYDVDEEVELLVDNRGERGIPSTVREILDDCQEAKDTLMDIASRLQNALKGAI